jgi:hypothetical protein
MKYTECNKYAIVNGCNDSILHIFGHLEEAVNKWKKDYADGTHKVVKINGFWEMED